MAGSYFVDNSGLPTCRNHPVGGASSSPWCTINYGISRIAGGDTLFVKRGTYREIVYINRPAGTARAATMIRAYPGHVVTIVGPGVSAGRVKIENTSYITFDGFTITNFNQGLFVDNAHFIVVQNNIVHHVGQEGIGVHLNSSRVTIQNNRVHDTRRWKYNGEGIYIGHGSTGSMDNTNNVLIKNNTIYNVMDEGIELKPGTHDCIVEGNNVSRALLNPAFSGSGAGTIEVNEAINGNQVWHANPNHLVRNNRVHDTKMGIRAGTGATLYNNVIYNINGSFPGIYITNSNGDSYTREVYHNTVDLPSSRAIVVHSGTANIKNNIGAIGTSNIATSDKFYLNRAKADYRLAAGAPPINTGLDLTTIVSKDILGRGRSTDGSPDLGAYEYVGEATNLLAPSTLIGLSIP